MSSLAGVTLVGVVDVNAPRAQDIAARYGTRAYTDAAEVLDLVDAVTVAVPTESHLAVARPFLERGIAALVEKPIARSVREAEALIDAARTGGAVLAAGHTERYNPAVQAALPLVTTPKFVEVHRLGVFPERSLDIDVVFDLMIHDLDVVLALVRSPVASVEAVGVPVLTPRVDIANARLRFESGCIANITASRISRDRVRKIRFFQPDAYISIDYAAKEVEAYRLARRDGERPSIEGGRLAVPQDEPLALELADFVGAAREKREPMVTGEDGRRAVILAEQITREIEGA
jgi:predicted dehydrogenase